MNDAPIGAWLDLNARNLPVFRILGGAEEVPDGLFFDAQLVSNAGDAARRQAVFNFPQFIECDVHNGQSLVSNRLTVNSLAGNSDMESKRVKR